MELLAFRSLYLEISSNQHLIKSISMLSRITYIQYPHQSLLAQNNSKDKDKKMRCWICAQKFGLINIKNYDQVLMLVLHIELMHPDSVESYEVGSDTIVIKTYQASNRQHPTSIKYIQTVPSNNQNISINNQSTNSYFLSNKLPIRLKQVTNNVVSKLKKLLSKSEQTFYHSTDIFRKISEDSMDEDSEEQLGEVQRELEKLRIQDFTDVNQNDKKFFIQWNNYIHTSKKDYGIIFRHDINKIFIRFGAIAKKKGIPRINFVMHAWTLWSVGMIEGADVIKGLSQYDSQGEQMVENIDNS